MLYHVSAKQVAITQFVKGRNKCQEHEEDAEQKIDDLAALDPFCQVVAFAKGTYRVEI